MTTRKRRRDTCKRRDTCTPAEKEETPVEEEDEKSIAVVDSDSLVELGKSIRRTQNKPILDRRTKTLNKDIHIRTDIVSTATEFHKNLYKDKARISTNKTGTETADYHSIQPIHETEAHQILATPLTELFNSIHKKGDPKNISNYRPISLLPNIYKLFSSIINNILSPIIEAKQPIEQAGFRKGHSTIDHIHTVELIIEKYQELQRPLYITLIDYQKAFDSVTHSRTIKLETLGPAFHIERGVRQGDPLSPTIFIAILESIIDGLDWSKTGLLIKGAYLNHLRFTDDLVLLSETVNEMQSMIESLQKASTKVGLEVNLMKTKIITNSRIRPITISGNPIEYMENYIYLGKRIRGITKATNALTFAQKRKWQWAGHVARMTEKRWTTRVTQWKGPPGKRRRVRPLTRWEEDLKSSAGSDWYSIAQDRQKWASLEEAFTQTGILVDQ
ncbi:Retrovirus-related Pol polyprotein from type-1 retrotransposable element R2 [Eumeta japonica]|uniref:Retrovirus-related Pol polyprotein from type-1 retrotransposable element R2 n=1 Tax=Eumeta variegata TaxID=151549 RepID=A0A4C1WQ80_EUMVA|nr:Retrovirus-related Pol polyprotein from type-1 retrotransposable element R2 [Eumeta japonica]